MSHIAEFLLTVMSLITVCTSMPNLHRQMSAHQLQSVFQVDSIHDVPHYEIVQLQHKFVDLAGGNDNAHYRRRRSILPATENHIHVKKDLSKNQYYSELKHAAEANDVAWQSSKSVPKDLSKLKEHNVSFNAFGENMNLNLHATQGLFKGGAPHKLPMWTVSSEANATNGLNLQEILDEETQSSDKIGHVFQDEKNMAAILMRKHEETGELIMEGSIGHEMVIKPVPHELSPNKEQAHHIIYKREAVPLDHLSDFAYMEPDDLATNEKLKKRHRRSMDEQEQNAEEQEEEGTELESEASNVKSTRGKRQTPYIIYPEVLVIVDYDGYRLHGGDNLQVKRYFISFWNGVDLRYRLLKGPRIRISIAGIIISRGRDATPYLERNRVGRDAIDSAAALTDMGKYLFRERRLPVYDIAVAITKYDMCRRRKGGRCTKGTAGFAYVGGACVVNKRLEKVNSVAIIEDTGGFSGIIVAAHEVGHLLGAVHDGSPPPSYLGGPGAQRCRWEDGYIMSDLRHTERGFKWSPCTVQSFHHFLNGDTATCLHNAPHEDTALGRSLPGTLLSLDAQCRRDRGTYACFKDERVCAQLFCFDAQTGYCVAYRPAAEGSSCGTGMHCLDGRCTALPANVIPEYGQQYRFNETDNNTINNLVNGNNSSNVDENNEENHDVIEAADKENEATNETFDKTQKRKLRLQQQLELIQQQQQSPVTSSAPTQRNDVNVGQQQQQQRYTTAMRHSFLDGYFKKFQALNKAPGTVLHSTRTSTSTASKQNDQEQQHQQPQYFLKRTLKSSSSSSSSSSSVSDKNNNYKYSSKKLNSRQKQDQQQQQQLDSITMAPLYVTDHVADTTNQFSQQQHFTLESTTAATQQQQQTRKLTQKLFRRRTAIK